VLSTRRSPMSSEADDRALVSKNKRRILNDTDKGVLLIMALVTVPVMAAAAIIASIAR
jgi:hypothetical protein